MRFPHLNTFGDVIRARTSDFWLNTDIMVFGDLVH